MSQKLIKKNFKLTVFLSFFFSFSYLAFPIETGFQKGLQEGTLIFECEDCKSEDDLKVLNLRTCNIVSHKRNLMQGELSDYWAQELIGSDFIHNELKNTFPPEREDWIAIFDSKIENHNIHVKNLISDEGPHAVLPELEDRKVIVLNVNLKNKAPNYKPALLLYETRYPRDFLFGFKKKSPRYINNSLGWSNSVEIYDVFKKLSSSKISQSVVIVSSGNDFPIRLDDVEKKASKDFDIILVGSFSPHGFVSEFSQSGDEISILAPSDSWITSAGQNGEYIKFAGTSGAAPLVTGSLAGFEWLSGYHPTAKEAKILLEKTAIPTLHSFEKPLINGAGLLNAYKMGEIAKRLKKKCKNKSAVKTRNCFKKEILEDDNYHFAKDESLQEDLKRIFPFCYSEDISKLSMDGCKKKNELFNRLRKELLLNPTKEYYNSLSCLYRSNGFFMNAKALDHLSLALDTESELRAKIKAMLATEESISKDILRLALAMGGFEENFNHENLKEGIKIAGGIGEASLPLLKRAIETKNPELQKQALLAASQVGEKALPLIKQAFETGNLERQKEILQSMNWVGEKALPLLKQAFKTGNPELQMAALYPAFWLREKALPLLELAFETGNFELQKEALLQAGEIGGKTVSLLERAFETGDFKLQRAALYSAGFAGEKALPLLKRAFETGNLKLQTWALLSTHRAGEKALPLIKRAFETGNLELQTAALNAAHGVGEKALPLLKQGFETGNLELQTAALISAKQAGGKALPLLKKGFETGNLELQKEALTSAGWMGEKALPLLKQGFETGNPELQKLALISADSMGEKALPLLERAFETGNLELQKRAVLSADSMGEKALPLLERAFETGNLELQKRAVLSAQIIGKKAKPFIDKLSRIQNLSEDIKKYIKEILSSYKN